MLRPLLHQPDIPREGHPRTAVRYFKDIRYYLFYMLQYVKWKHWYMYLKYNIENRSLPVYKNFIMSFQNQTDFFSKYPRYNIVQCLIMKFFFTAESGLKHLRQSSAWRGTPPARVSPWFPSCCYPCRESRGSLYWWTPSATGWNRTPPNTSLPVKPWTLSTRSDTYSPVIHSCRFRTITKNSVMLMSLNVWHLYMIFSYNIPICAGCQEMQWWSQKNAANRTDVPSSPQPGIQSQGRETQWKEKNNYSLQ